MNRFARPNANWLLAFVPAAMLLDQAAFTSPPVLFLTAALGIVPVARLIGNATEHLSAYTGESAGGLLNATFGNLPELIIGLVALRAGLYEVVSAALIGAILFNLLLVLGLGFLLGGLRRHTVQFNAQAASFYSSMMFIAVISLVLPSIYQRVVARDSELAGHDEVNVALALVLIGLYGLYLLFALRTHPEVFASVRHGSDATHEAHWSLARCLTTLAIASVLAALLSEILVGAVEGTGEALGLSPAFLGVILLASVGGAAEGVSAVTMAWKGRFDLSLSIALGSCTLIALFVAPVLVFASFAIGPHPFGLSFSAAGLALLFLAVLIAALVASGGTANWYKGVQLMSVYLMIALLLYFLPS